MSAAAAPLDLGVMCHSAAWQYTTIMNDIFTQRRVMRELGYEEKHLCYIFLNNNEKPKRLGTFFTHFIEVEKQVRDYATGKWCSWFPEPGCANFVCHVIDSRNHEIAKELLEDESEETWKRYTETYPIDIEDQIKALTIREA